MIMQRLSLLARGTPKIVAPVEMVWRFIPADAGNTVELYAVATVGAVYPRWRGEHPLPPNNPIFDPGLSPLARGTLPWC
ncbi:hypothetical protein SEEJ0720_09085 [Salmonella enterica subsp. enterica serovar Javiana str. PRS_2010_0720]|nr:hypothetical protein SEEJ1593_16119 [Salmonella enterica subsp. enterica serovar Javiana str. ATCC BAA-1593]ESH03187.1 hypothetical protein SEEJ0720_09085 [Salmonella enterica subsp. enterica serovar Javiana str. PRS_2010_0720]